MKEKVIKEISKEIKEVEKNFKYFDAGENAQTEVKKAIERFRKLPYDQRKKEALLYWLLGEGTPDFKFSKKEVLYTDKSEIAAQTCENCEFAYVKLYTLSKSEKEQWIICAKVNEEETGIRRKGWCNRWRKMSQHV